MGGMNAIKGLRTLRAEVVYPDHDASAVCHEMRRPNRMRNERKGDYASVFDGKRGAMLKYDKSKPGQAPAVQVLPEDRPKASRRSWSGSFPRSSIFRPNTRAGSIGTGRNATS